MKTTEQNFETIRYYTSSGFMKHIKVSKENPKDFKIGDKFLFHWGGVTSIDCVDKYTSQREIDELNGNVEKSESSIDLVYSFWKCVRKILE